MEGIPEADIRDHEAQKQSGRIMTAEGADSSDEEGGSAAKKMKAVQPVVPDAAAANVPSMGAMQMPSLLTSPFVGVNPMTHYLGHLPMPVIGGMPQMLLGGPSSASSQNTPKPINFPSSGSSPSSSSSSTKPAFAAYSSTGAGATIVGESTVPKKSGIIATQAGSTKIMHPEEDISLEEMRARRPRYQKNAIATNLSQAPVASQVTPVNQAHMGLPMGHIPAGMMIPPHMLISPHMQMGMGPMGGILRAPHMPGLPGGFSPYPPLGFPLQMPPRFR